MTACSTPRVVGTEDQWRTPAVKLTLVRIRF